MSASARYWRLSQIEPDAKLALSMTRLEVWDDSARIDLSATFTSTFAPSTGSLAYLQDGDPGTACSFSAVTADLPGFRIEWDFGSAVTVRSFRWAAATSSEAPRGLWVEYSSDGVAWTFAASQAALTPAAPGGDVVLTLTPYGGVLMSAKACSGGASDPTYNVAATTDPSWPANYSNTSAIGVFAYTAAAAGVAAGQTSATGVINYFSLNDIWTLTASCATYNGDDAKVDIEFLRADDTVMAALCCRRPSAFYTYMYVGPSLGALSIQPSSGSPTLTYGEITFTASQIKYRNLVGGSNFTSDFTYSCDLSAVTKLRVTVLAKEVATAAYSAYARVQLAASWVAGNNAALANVRSSPPTDAAMHVRYVGSGGTGIIQGTVKVSPNTPIRRKVWLLNEATALIERETWSDKTTGTYAFEYLDTSARYSVIAFDDQHSFGAVIADNITPEAM